MTEFDHSENVLSDFYVFEMNSTDLSQRPFLSQQQLDVLINLVQVDDPVVKQKVIAHNIRLVVNIAKRYNDRGVELMQLVAEGTKGLIHALENFELEGGFRFTSYAAQCVRHSIERTILKQPLSN